MCLQVFIMATFGLDTQSGLFSHACKNRWVPHPVASTSDGMCVEFIFQNITISVTCQLLNASTTQPAEGY